MNGWSLLSLKNGRIRKTNPKCGIFSFVSPLFEGEDTRQSQRNSDSQMPLDSPNHQPMYPESLPLTPRELQVLKELALGHSNKTIAKILFISTYTVDGYVKDIYRKLGVRNRSMAAVFAFQHGILDMTSSGLGGFRSQSA